MISGRFDPWGCHAVGLLGLPISLGGQELQQDGAGRGTAISIGKIYDN